MSKTEKPDAGRSLRHQIYRPMSMSDRERAQTGVAKPSRPDLCWAEVAINLGPDWSLLSSCGNPARKGFLTCIKHTNREDAARLAAGQSAAATADWRAPGASPALT